MVGIKDQNESKMEARQHNPIVYGDLSFSTACQLLNQRKTSKEYLPCYRMIDDVSDEPTWLTSLIIGGQKETVFKKKWCDFIPESLGFTIPHLSSYIRMQNYESNSINILYMIPWMVMGGADLYDLKVLKSLKERNKNVHITLIVARHILEHVWESQYVSLVNEVFHLQRLTNDSIIQDQIVDHLIKTRKVKLIINSRTVAGYEAFKRLNGSTFIKKVDILHMYDPDSRDDWEWRAAQVQEAIDKRIVVSQNLKDRFIQHIGQGDAVLGVQSKFRPLSQKHKDKIKVIYPPLDIDTFIKSRHCIDSLDCFEFRSHEPTLLFIGRLDSQKMPQMFLEVARTLPWAGAKMIGSGPFGTILKNALYSEQKYTELSRKLNWTGSIPHDQIPYELIHSSRSVLIQTSKNDGVPIIVMEALALGTPVVTQVCGGVTELIEDPIWDVKPHIIHQYAHERLYTMERFPHASLIRVNCEFLHKDPTLYNDVIHLMSIEATAQLQSLTKESRFSKWIQAQPFLQKYSHLFKKEWESVMNEFNF